MLLSPRRLFDLVKYSDRCIRGIFKEESAYLHRVDDLVSRIPEGGGSFGLVPVGPNSHEIAVIDNHCP